MNKDIIQWNWHEIKDKIKQQWSEVTDDEISQMEGTYEELEDILQSKYGYQQDEAKNQIEQFLYEKNMKEHAN